MKRIWTARLFSEEESGCVFDRLRLLSARRISAFRSAIVMKYLPEIGIAGETGIANKPIGRYANTARYGETTNADRPELIRGTSLKPFFLSPQSMKTRSPAGVTKKPLRYAVSTIESNLALTRWAP